jgi:hypothetical protein
MDKRLGLPAAVVCCSVAVSVVFWQHEGVRR